MSVLHEYTEKSAGKIGYGTTLWVESDDSPGNYLLIGELVEPPNVGESKSLVDFTHTLSPKKRREYKGGLVDGDEISISCTRIEPEGSPPVGDAGQERIFDLFDQDDPVFFEARSPNDVEVERFLAIVMNWNKARPINEPMRLNFTLKMAGDIERVYNG
jgi:hypothetical protein